MIKNCSLYFDLLRKNLRKPKIYKKKQKINKI